MGKVHPNVHFVSEQVHNISLATASSRHAELVSNIQVLHDGIYQYHLGQV